MILWLAGLASGLGRLASTSNNFFLGLGAISGQIHSFPLSLRLIPEWAAGPAEAGQIGNGLGRGTGHLTC